MTIGELVESLIYIRRNYNLSMTEDDAICNACNILDWFPRTVDVDETLQNIINKTEQKKSDSNLGGIGMLETKKDTINHPEHYQGTYECIDEMIALFGVDAVKSFCRCNVYKYRYRADRKNGAEDLAKADWYMGKLMELDDDSSSENEFKFTTTTYYK